MMKLRWDWPSGDDSAIRVDIIGGDLPHITAGASAIVGSSSSAIFHDGVTVRGGSNDVGDADDYKRACRY